MNVLLIAMSIGREFDPKSENEFPIITIFQEKKSVSTDGSCICSITSQEVHTVSY